MDVAELTRLLDLPPHPTEDDVRHARRRLAKRLHPDTHGAGPGVQMSEVNEACDRLLARIRAAGTRRHGVRHRSHRPVDRSARRSAHHARRRPLAEPGHHALPEFRLVHAALTVLWLAAGFVLGFAVAGSIAVALLAGSLAAAAMMAILVYVIPTPTTT